MKKIFQILTLTILLSSCSKGNSDNTVEEENKSKFSKSEIAIFTISSIMHQSPAIISAKSENSIYLVSYERPSDGQVFKYKIKFGESNRIL